MVVIEVRILFKKSKAISYSEIIIVLLIIGVISSVSVPAVKKHSQKNELGVLAKKAFLSLNQVVDNAILVNGPTRNWSVPNSQAFFSFLLPSFTSLSKGLTAVLTKDKMRFHVIGDEMQAYTTVYVDVNGTEVGPNKTGKDIHSFQIMHNNGTVEPVGDTLELAKNSWQFTDELWYK